MEKYYYVYNNEKLATNLIPPFTNSALKSYPVDLKRAIEEEKRNEEILKEIEKNKKLNELYDSINKSSDVNYISKFDFSANNSDRINDLIKRRNRVRSEYDWSASWDYHGLYDPKYQTYRDYLYFDNKPKVEPPKMKKLYLDLKIENIEESKVLRPQLYTEKTELKKLLPSKLEDKKIIKEKIIFK